MKRRCRRRSLVGLLRYGDPETTALLAGSFLAPWSWWYAAVTTVTPSPLDIVASPFVLLPGASTSWVAGVFTAVAILWASVVLRPDQSRGLRVATGLAVIACWSWVGISYALRTPVAWRSTATPIYLGLLPALTLWSVGRLLVDARRWHGR